jgi:hypothetical protein
VSWDGEVDGGKFPARYRELQGILGHFLARKTSLVNNINGLSIKLVLEAGNFRVDSLLFI